jgi:hypothetical protein
LGGIEDIPRFRYPDLRTCSNAERQIRESAAPAELEDSLRRSYRAAATWFAGRVECVVNRPIAGAIRIDAGEESQLVSTRVIEIDRRQRLLSDSARRRGTDCSQTLLTDGEAIGSASKPHSPRSQAAIRTTPSSVARAGVRKPRTDAVWCGKNQRAKYESRRLGTRNFSRPRARALMV